MLICMHKINLITHFFHEILQRNRKLVVFGNLAYLATYISVWRNRWCLSEGKNQLHPSHFPSDIAKILQTCYFGYFGHVWLCTLSTCRKFLCLSADKKSTSPPTVILEILQRYANLFWILSACLALHNQNDSIQFQKTLIFICMPKINFTIYISREVLHFKESSNLTGQQQFGP